MSENDASPVTPEPMAHGETPVSPSGTQVDSEVRHQLASKLVDRYSLWGGVAGLIPIPIADVVAIGGVQFQMLRRLSQMYDVPFSENSGKALLASLAGMFIPATSGVGAASLLKSIPVAGTLAAAFVMPVLSSGATFAIGKAFIQHFESGGTLLDFNPPDYREFLRTQKELWDLRRRKLKRPARGGPDEAAPAETAEADKAAVPQP
jgi:uncharacterized protein (DUF697 family)